MEKQEWYTYLTNNNKGAFIEIYERIEQEILRNHIVDPIVYGRAHYFIDWNQPNEMKRIEFRHLVTQVTIYIREEHLDLANRILNDFFEINFGVGDSEGWIYFRINNNNREHYNHIVDLLSTIIQG